MAQSLLRRWWKQFWHGVEVLRRALFNLLFLLMLVVAAAWLWPAGEPSIPKGSVLVIAPAGTLTDELSALDPLQWLAGGAQPLETRLLDLVEAIDRAARDDRIPALVLDVQELQGGGLSKLQELAAAIQRFRATGKPVIAFADTYDQNQYYLAAHADEVLLNPMGAVVLEGYAVYQHYVREALDKLLIDVNVFRIGEYKSAVEPFTRNDMSPAARRANEAWLHDLWQQYVEAVARQRTLAPEQIAEYAEHYAERLKGARGDPAQLALDAGLVDQLLPRPGILHILQERFGVAAADSYPAVDVATYLAATDSGTDGQPLVGLIVANGLMLDGEQPAGTVGGDSLAARLREARLDDEIRAVVLRIDSEGGSAFAAEIIRQELLQLKSTGKPVVVSMGTTAASGGYWIAADADQIWATPATLTGSIGIFGALPTIDRSLQRLGIHTDGIGTTSLAGGFRMDRPLSPAHREVMEQMLDAGYRRFIELVATGRDMPIQHVESVAQGRVWSGLAAQDVGLVDQLGGLHDAQRAAAELAGLTQSRLHVMEPPISIQEWLLREMIGVMAVALEPAAKSWPWAVAAHPMSTWQALWQRLTHLNDPQGMYLLCTVCTPP